MCLRKEIIDELREAKQPKSNLTKEEWTAIKKLKDDKDIIILPADKGKCLVVMNKKEYIQKMETKLSDETTYTKIDNDPTNDIKQLLSQHLNLVRDRGEIDDKTYYKLFPTKTTIPRMWGQPKIHKTNYPLREIVDSIGSVAKECDKHISKILQQYTGQTDHYVKNSAHFVSTIKDLKVEEDETLVSYDVTALYPSIPQEEAIQIFHQRMSNDPQLKEKTKMSADNVIKLFRICVETTYFMFNGNLYRQVDGLAIGASSSGFAAELFMIEFESKAITSFISPPTLWKRFVDDTFSKIKTMYIEAFLEHLNSQHPRIKFTSEVEENNQIAFLDTLIHILPDRTTKVTIYRKSTHTDQYLDFQSNHHIKQKIGIISTFKHRINELVTTEEDKQQELRHVKKALKRCGHPNWSLNRKKKRISSKDPTEKKGKVIIPYIQGTSEKLSKIYKKYNIEAIHKPSTTLKNILCNQMKDQIHPLDKTGTVYYNNCKTHNNQGYVGETGRVLRERLYEHKIIDHDTSKKAASLRQTTIEEETQTNVRRSARINQRTRRRTNYQDVHTGRDQPLTEGNTEFSAHVASDFHSKEDLEWSIIYTEPNYFKRGVKEAIAIKKLQPDLNLDGGRYHLPPVYDRLIRSSLKIKGPRHGTNDSPVSDK